MKRLACVALWLIGCGSSTPEPQNMTIGIAGGVVSTDDGSSVQVPMGAVTAEVLIGITPMTDPAAPAAQTVVGAGYLFEPEGATFTTPVKIVLAVDTSKLPAGKTIDDVRIFTAPGGSTEYTMLATTVTDATHVSATTSHFSTFLPAVTTPVTMPTCMGQCLTTTSGSCTCMATCADVAYQMTCFNGEGCRCGGTGGPFVSAHPFCTDLAGLNAAWTTPTSSASCGYPGTLTFTPSAR